MHFNIVLCRLWQTFLVALVVYSAWASPFELAFRELLAGSLLTVDLLVDAFFAVDIILTFFVAYLDTSTYLLVDDHKKIALRFVYIPSTFTCMWGSFIILQSPACTLYLF